MHPLWRSYLDRFCQSWSQLGLKRDETSFLIAVSGGIDSVLLLETLASTQIRLGIDRLLVVYVDHGLRPKDTERESLWVEQKAKKLGVSFRPCKIVVPLDTGSIQDAARIGRRKALEHILKQEYLDLIVTGHHADDQAETVLQRFLRGTGPAGLAGIHPRSGNWLHPMLPFYRKEIQNLAELRALNWLEDPSNRKTKYLRNRLRLELIPQLKASFNPNLEKHLNQLSLQCTADEAFFEQQLSSRLQPPLLRFEERQWILSTKLWKELPKALQWRAMQRIIRLFKVGDLERQHLLRLCSLAESSDGERRISVPWPFQIHRSYEQMFFSLRQEESESLEQAHFSEISSFSQEFSGEGEFLCPLGRLVIQRTESFEAEQAILVDKSGFLSSNDGLVWQAFLPELEKDSLPKGLLRNRRPGDKMKFVYGHKKLKRWMIDQKIPQSKRSQFPLLLLEEQIGWVIGWACAEPFTQEPLKRGWLFRFFPSRACFQALSYVGSKDKF